MLRPDTFALTAVLALLTAVGPLSVDMYLPSLPDIGRELAAPPAQVQLTISFYLVGFALADDLADRASQSPRPRGRTGKCGSRSSNRDHKRLCANASVFNPRRSIISDMFRAQHSALSNVNIGSS